MTKYDYLYLQEKNYGIYAYRIKFLDLFVNNKFITQKTYDGTTFAPQNFKTQCSYDILSLSPGENNTFTYNDTMPKPEPAQPANITKTQNNETYNITFTITIIREIIILTVPINISFLNRNISNSVDINFTVSNSNDYNAFIVNQHETLVQNETFILNNKTLTNSGKILPNTDATLKSLNISAGTLSPKFVASKTSYKVSVPSKVKTFTITPTMNKYATITVNNKNVTSGKKSQNITLKTGNNTIKILVTSQDKKTKKTYTLTVNKQKSVILPKFHSNNKLLLLL